MERIGVSDGGVAAAFGFRYQYLATVRVLLDLLADRDAGSWRVDVDAYGQDSADIALFRDGRDAPVSVMQVKESLASSATTMSLPALIDHLTRLAVVRQRPGLLITAGKDGFHGGAEVPAVDNVDGAVDPRESAARTVLGGHRAGFAGELGGQREQMQLARSEVGSVRNLV